MAHYFLVGGKGFQAGGAIKLAASNADLTPARSPTRSRVTLELLQRRAAEGFYQQHINEAKKILDAWGGASTTYTVARATSSARARRPSTGTRENYWDASGRLVDERHWRRFASRNALWLGPDSWFFKNRPTYVIDGNENFAEQGVLGLTATRTSGCRSRGQDPRDRARWTAGAGTSSSSTRRRCRSTGAG
jgi:hypothetical protein